MSPERAVQKAAEFRMPHLLCCVALSALGVGPLSLTRMPLRAPLGPIYAQGSGARCRGLLHPGLRCVAPSALFIASSPISESVLNAPDSYNNKIGRISITKIRGRKSTTVPPGMFFRRWRSAHFPQTRRKRWNACLARMVFGFRMLFACRCHRA
jgi:hypothetical protein